MIPIRDINPRRHFPVVTMVLVALNILVFVFEMLIPTEAGLDSLAFTWGLVPYELTTLKPIALVTLFTSMFIHGGLLHLGSNMLYLWIFGDNIENALGSLRFAFFYLLCGVGAALAQVLTGPSSTIPMVGASGAISGVLGAYLVLFPKAQVETLVFLGYFLRLVRLPAAAVLGMWILLQLLSGFASLGMEATGGVAFFAHIGGFFSGIVLVLLLRRRRWWE